MTKELILQFTEEIKKLYPFNIVYTDLYTYDNGPILKIDFGHSAYELELNSLHYTDSEGDLIIEQCKQIFLQYRRQHMLQQLV
jgi:hypothetical protein